MSSENLSINPAVFAEAIQELPLSAVYGKVAELRNSIAHLHRSNTELLLFIADLPRSENDDEEKKELEGYIAENEGVIASMNERLSLLKTELENRAQPWIETEQVRNVSLNDEDTLAEAGANAPTTNGTSGDARVNQNQGSEAGQGSENGVYL